MKSSHKSIQTRVEAITHKTAGSFKDAQISEKELLETLREKLRYIDSKIPRLPKDHPERRRLGIEKFALAEQVKILRNKGNLKLKPIANCFMDVVRENIDKPTFDLWLQLAEMRREEPSPSVKETK